MKRSGSIGNRAPSEGYRRRGDGHNGRVEGVYRFMASGMVGVESAIFFPLSVVSVPSVVNLIGRFSRPVEDSPGR